MRVRGEGRLVLDGGWLPLPTRPRRYCKPALLVFILNQNCLGNECYCESDYCNKRSANLRCYYKSEDSSDDSDREDGKRSIRDVNVNVNVDVNVKGHKRFNFPFKTCKKDEICKYSSKSNGESPRPVGCEKLPSKQLNEKVNVLI